MAEIVKIKKDGVIQYPITKPECVIDENGKNVLQLIKENGGGSTPDLSGYLTKEEFNKASEDFATTDALEGKQDTIEDLNSIRSGAEKGATAVQPSILEDYATTQQLTELSAEVGGLSERIDNLPSAESDVFKAIYGETTIEQITEAYNQGKIVHCDYKNNCYVLSKFVSGSAFFSALNANYSARLYVRTNSSWSFEEFALEENKNKVKTISAESTDTQYPSAKAVYDALQNVGGGGSGGDDTSLREAIFGKTSSKEIAINGYHAPTADTLAVNIAQGEVFHFRLETLGAAVTKYQFFVKYDGDSSQTSMAYFSADENYSMYAIRPIVEFGISTSSGWVTEKGNVRLTVTQGGIKEPYNLMELGVITIEDSVDNIDVLEYVPDLLKFKKLKVLSQFTYSAERSPKGTIILNTENVSMGVILENLMGAATKTHYIFDITLDKSCIEAYIECHSNSFANPQIQDSNIGKNMATTLKGNPINAFVINLPLLAGDKFIFYGK